MPRSFLHAGAAATFALVIVGCGPATPQARLVGRWKGATEVTEAVDAMVQSAAPGQEVNPLAQGAARFLGKALAKATMSVEIDLRPSGTVFLRGNTDLLDLPADSEGTWTVLSADEDRAKIEFEIGDQIVQAKIIFRDADEFTLKIEPPDSPDVARQLEIAVPAQPTAPAEKPAVAADDEDYEDASPPAQPPAPKPGPKAPVRPAPVIVKPAEAMPKKPPASILFKRDSS